MLNAFADDSADETQQRVFCVAAVIGRPCDWDELIPKWRERLGGRVFHAKDCETDRGDPKSSPHADNQKLYADLATMLSGSKLFGYSHAVSLVAAKTAFGDTMLRSSSYERLRNDSKIGAKTARASRES